MSKIKEELYQFNLEKILNGKHLNIPIIGITDITNDEFHAEIKCWNNWKNVVSQLLCYNMAAPRKELRAYFFGKKPKERVLEKIVRYLKTLGDIIPYHLEVVDDVIRIHNICTNTVQEHQWSYNVVDNNFGFECNVHNFIRDFPELYCENTKDNDIVINLDYVAKWINTRKSRLTETLKLSYKLGVDFVLRKARNPDKKDSRSNNYKECFITPNCFIKLCMLSKAKNADTIRYLIMKTKVKRSIIL